MGANQRNTTPARRQTWHPEAGWRDALEGRTPDEVLECLLGAEDPLRLRRLVACELRAAAILLDADQVHLRLIARVAHASGVEGGAGNAGWLEELAREAISDLLAAERRTVVARRRSVPDRSVQPGADAEEATPFDILARPFAFDGVALQAACDAFNRRSHAERHSFFALVVDRLDLDTAARELSSSPTDVARRARAALLAALAAAHSGAPDAAAAGAEVSHVQESHNR